MRLLHAHLAIPLVGPRCRMISHVVFEQALLLTMLHSKTYPFEGTLAAKVEYECKIRGAQRMG